MTSTALGRAHRIEICAPSGAAAMELERRLASLEPTAVCRHGRWVVDLGGVHSVEAIEAEIEAWLHHVGAAATTMNVDGRPTTVEVSRRGRHRATNADFSG